MNSTFATNNAVQDGGAVFLGGTFVLSHIDSSIFTSNTTLIGHGGAVSFAAGQLLAGTTAANVFVGNLAPSNPTSKSIFGGPFAFGVVPNNWYGCNEGPTNPACDGASNAIGGGLVFSPWIILSNSASPSSIPLNGTSTLTADFLHDSGGASLPATQVAALAGRTVTWNNAVNGSLSAQQTTIQSNGTATAVFTPAALGSGSADATVDNATVTAVLTVDKGNPTIAITSDNPDPSVVGQTVTVQ